MSATTHAVLLELRNRTGLPSLDALIFALATRALEQEERLSATC